jgi:pimeloyl-ACP methyl ester carboxylesterase
MASSFHKLLCLGPHGFHYIAYKQWGELANNRHLVCVHGLTRNSQDFDRFAAVLQHDYRVTCPDVVGRGRSDWLPVKTDYGYPLYVSDMATLLGRLDTEVVDWVGTSMGGLIGMHLAAKPNAPIRRLVLNDIGPLIPAELIKRILTYLGDVPTFDTLKGAKDYLQDLYQGFGPLTEDQWLEVAVNSTYQNRDGSYTLAYDPGIADSWRGTPLDEVKDQDLWDVWDAIQCPVLVLRGAESDALPAEVAEEMRRRGPKAEVINIPETGHCPPLMDPEQIERVRQWLLKD